MTKREIAVKHGLGRLDLPESPDDYVPSRMAHIGIRGLPIEHAHALAIASLDGHHRDPFDRILIAQAGLEKMQLATADPVFSMYTDQLLTP